MISQELENFAAKQTLKLNSWLPQPHNRFATYLQ